MKKKDFLPFGDTLIRDNVGNVYNHNLAMKLEDYIMKFTAVHSKEIKKQIKEACETKDFLNLEKVKNFLIILKAYCEEHGGTVTLDTLKLVNEFMEYIECKKWQFKTLNVVEGFIEVE